jgi:2-oxoglutarate/2-oxoacid ferredoxin oxidoreductase subunit beta
VHGRALPVATGLALTRPDLTVIATGGDGDGFSIGGNHFIHACRRNVNFTYLVMDNEVYGMTKGQASPTTESDWTGSKLAPQGTHQPPFQPLEMALAAGAPFIARGLLQHAQRARPGAQRGHRVPGFAFVQVLSPCITFRPEQLHWKKQVHEASLRPPTSARPTSALLEDDGFGTGISTARRRACFRPDVAEPR